MENASAKIEASLMALLDNKEFDKITVRELCDLAQVSRRTFYYYYRDKHQVIEEIFSNTIIKPLKALMEANVNSREIIRILFQKINEHKKFYMKAIKIEGQNSLLQVMIEQLQKVNLSVLAAYSFEPEDQEYIAYYFASGYAMFIMKWINEGMAVNPLKMAAYYYDMACVPFERILKHAHRSFRLDAVSKPQVLFAVSSESRR